MTLKVEFKEGKKRYYITDTHTKVFITEDIYSDIEKLIKLVFFSGIEEERSRNANK